MSIASEITRLQGVKADILQAIADKGVTVPAGSVLDDCPGLISSISGGASVGGWPYQGKFLTYSESSSLPYGSRIIYDIKDNCFYGLDHQTLTSNFDNRRAPKFHRSGGVIQRTDEIEISVDFKVDFYGVNQNAFILTGSTDTYNTVGSSSIDFNTDNGIIVFLMANNNGWGNSGNAISVSSNKINIDYVSNHICNVKVKHYANTDDFEMWFEGEQSAESTKTFTAPKYGGTCDMVLGGIYNNINSMFNNLGRIYFSSYIKYNGEFLPFV